MRFSVYRCKGVGRDERFVKKMIKMFFFLQKCEKIKFLFGLIDFKLFD